MAKKSNGLISDTLGLNLLGLQDTYKNSRYKLATSGKMNSEEKDLLNARNKIWLYIGDDIYKKIANKEQQLAAKLKYEEEHRYEQKKTRGKA